MPEYRVTIKPSATKEIDRLPINVASRVVTKIDALAATPRPPGVMKLEGEPVRWRIRVGDIIYVRHRSKAYDS